MDEPSTSRGLLMPQRDSSSRKGSTDSVFELVGVASLPAELLATSGMKLARTKSDSQAVRSRSVSHYEDSSPVRRSAKLSVPERLRSRSKSWDAALGGIDQRLADLIRREKPSRSSKRKAPLQSLCLHCRYASELRKSRVTAEIGKAVQTIAQEVEVTFSYPEERRRRRISLQPTNAAGSQAAPSFSRPKRVPDPNAKPPDIVVSSVSSDEDDTSQDDTSQDASLHDSEAMERSGSEASTSETSTSPSDFTGDSDDSLGALYSESWAVGVDIPSIAISQASMGDLRGQGVVRKSERSCSIATAASEAETLIFQPSPSPDALSLSQPSSPWPPSQPPSPMPPESPLPAAETPTMAVDASPSGSPKNLTPPNFSPPASPAPKASPSIAFTADVDFAPSLSDAWPGLERPILDSVSSGKTPCSCLPPGCLGPWLHRNTNSSKPSSGSSSAILSYCSSAYAKFSSASGQFLSSTDSARYRSDSPGQGSPDNSSLFLEPPSVGSQRSSSVDLPTLTRDLQLLSSAEEDGSFGSDESASKVRSKSVDCGLHPSRRPSRMQRIAYLFRKALVRSPIIGARSPILASAATEALANPPARAKASRYWHEGAGPTDHLWVAEVPPNSECGVGERECRKTGEKWQCSGCHLIVHAACLHLLPRMHFLCKPTYQDSSSRFPIKAFSAGGTPSAAPNPPLGSPGQHHWVHRWKQDGKCARCLKSFGAKLFGRERDILAISCSWCKVAFHNRQGCFLMADLEAECDRGSLRDLIVPPDWVLKLPAISSRVSGIRRRLSHCQGGPSTHKRRSRKARLFTVKPPEPMPLAPAAPLVIFVNPKSGGNKGAKLLNAFHWLLNPRQVFDIMAMKGPKYGLEMYRKLLPRLRILVCGGDGTVGWVLATLDALRWPTYPPMAILPLGTGNDLARTLGWGGTFPEGEAVGELLRGYWERADVTQLDRWSVEVSPNTEAEWEETVAESAESVSRTLPLTVFNNYFSIGADAHVALQFHHSRSANPEILNSRFKNRLFYGGIGGLDLFKRSWKDLCNYLTIVCDGVDLTPKIRDSKFHCLLFLNIPRYAGGTQPWGSTRALTPSGEEATEGTGLLKSSSRLQPPGGGTSPATFTQPAINDGRMEVLGFTSATLAAIQMGGHGERLAQCRSVKIQTTKPIPAQMDGEPCRLAPSHISIRFHSKAFMLQKSRGAPSTNASASPSLSASPRRSPSRKGSLRARFDRTSSAAGGGRSESVSSGRIEAILLQIPVAVLSYVDFEGNKDDAEQLKLRAYEMGLVSVNSEAELDSVRDVVSAALKRGRKPPKYLPGGQWHFVDYVSCHSAFRVPMVEEAVHSVSDIANPDEVLLILDEAAPANQAPEEPASPRQTEWQRRRSSRKRRKRFAQPLKMVLTGDKGETAL